MHLRNKLFLLPALLPLFFTGCGPHEPLPAKSGSPVSTVAVESIVPVRSSGHAPAAEELLVPKSAIFMKGDLEGVLVVGAGDLISVRWIRTGRSLNGDRVVLGGLEKGELVVGKYSAAINEGVTVKKSPRVTEEKNTNE